jgi:hypothetical protein
MTAAWPVRWTAVAAGCWAAALWPCVAFPAPDAGAGSGAEFIYYTRLHDTLIGLGRRLLVEPRRWPALQSLNRIANPRRIPQGSALRIPYDWLKTSAETATVAGVGGSVSRAGAAVTVGESLAQGSVIETGADGSVTIDLADGSVVTLQKSSTLKLDQMIRIDGVDAAHSTQLKLDAGRIDATVKPHRDVGRFEIITPVAVSAVRGTGFRDGYSPDTAHATTETLEGAVNVGSAAVATPVSVSAGFGTRIEQGGAPLPPVALLPPPDLSHTGAVLSAADVQFTWTAVPGAAAYRAQLADARDFHVLRADLVVSAPVALTADLPDGSYWLRVRSIDALGLEGSDALLQVTRHRLPAAPAPALPVEGARLSGTTTPFTWTAVDAAQRYRLQVAADGGFDAPLLDLPPLATAAVACCELPPGRYRWRVAGINAAGESGPWSPPRSFVRQADAPQPDAPLIEDRTLRLSWQGPSGQRYHLQLARDAGFRRVVLDRDVADASLTVPRPFPYDYYVRVRLVDADGTPGAYGPARAFTVPVPRWVEIVGHTVLLLPLLF